LCPEHELCITARCLEDDLAMSAETTFEEALRHPIVQALQEKRSTQTGSGKTVGPAAGPATLYHLGAGEDHRGATWFDGEEGVVWLCAYGWHRSGEPEDAFKHFARLLRDEVIYPDEGDYRRLLSARAHRFVELAPINAQSLRDRALENPGTVQIGQLGRRVQVRVKGDIIGDIAEISVAFAPGDLNQKQIAFILRCFAPDPGASLSDVADTLAGSPLLAGEIAFDIMTSA
jgi:hypothetical protein